MLMALKNYSGKSFKPALSIHGNQQNHKWHTLQHFSMFYPAQPFSMLKPYQ
jgi:hypothetical protein